MSLGFAAVILCIHDNVTIRRHESVIIASLTSHGLTLAQNSICRIISGDNVGISLAERVRLRSHGLKSVPLANLLIAVLAILLAFQIARLVWTIFTPVGPLRDWRAPSANVVPPAARVSLFAGFDPFFRNDAAPATGSVTSLNVALFGIRTNESSGGGSAIIAGEDGIQNSYAVGEEVSPGVILDSVAFDHVILSRGGVKESLYLDQSVPAETVNPGSGSASAPAAPLASGGAALNAATIQKSIGFAPRNEGGRVTGFILQPRDDGTMMRNAGFQAGDVIVAVNGRSISSSADIAAQFRPGARLGFDVERGGSKVPIALNLEQQ
jgi:general secretion pathway protein C